MKKIIILLLYIVVFVSCKSSRLSVTDTISEAETVILGNIKITKEGKDVTKNARIYFDENQKGILTYKMKEDGRIVMKLPKGNHFIKLICYHY